MKIHLNQPFSFSQLGKRGNQEDSRFPDCDEPKAPKPFFVVCDGVGGSEKGEVASRTVCDAFGEALASTDWSSEFTISGFERALDFAFRKLESVATPENAGMATTLTFAAFHGGGCFIAHIGDSRVYYVRPGSGIIYQTEDHSLVNALVRAGVITPEQAATHPDRNVITRAVCIPEKDQERAAATTVNLTDVRPGDCVLLCSDGVLKNLSDEQIAEILSSGESDKEKCRKIAEMSRDSDDNNTAYIVSVASVDEGPAVTAEIIPTVTRETAPARRPSSAKQGKGKGKKLPAGTTAGIAAGLALVAAAFLIVANLLPSTPDAAEEEPVEATEASRTDAPESDGEDEIEANPDKKAEFDGGAKALAQFFAKNAKYPADAEKAGKQGTVELELTIEKTGKVGGIRVVKSVYPSLDAEAARLCGLLPDFHPALTDEGETVRSTYRCSVQFKLPEKPQQQAQQPSAPANNGEEAKKAKKKEEATNEPQPINIQNPENKTDK